MNVMEKKLIRRCFQLIIRTENDKLGQTDIPCESLSIQEATTNPPGACASFALGILPQTVSFHLELCAIDPLLF